MKFYSDKFPQMSTVLPDGAEHGPVKIVHVTPNETDETVSRMRAIFGHGRGAVSANETITQLLRGGRLWMSDTQDERRDLRRARHHARGNVLIGGLGLGMFALMCAVTPEVKRVTVIEIDPDVIALILPHLKIAMSDHGVDPGKLEVVCADVREWKPPRSARYDLLFMDIWSDLCTDNLKEYGALNRKYARYKQEGGYRECWCQDLIRAIKKKDEAERRRRKSFGW